MYNLINIKYFEKPTGIDIFAEIQRGDEHVGWLEQAAYQAPHIYFHSTEIQEKFETETGAEVNGPGWEVFVERMIQDAERKFHGPEEYDKMLGEVLNG